jgi:beta-N-acetylhexosaminidase
MAAIGQGVGLIVDIIAAARAGVDLLLLTDSGEGYEAAYTALTAAAQRGLLSSGDIAASAQRVLDLKAWVREQEQPGLEVVACEEHRALAYEVAAEAVTLVRDDAGCLPVRLSPEDRVLAIVPRPQDLTPADTSSYEMPDVAGPLRRHHPYVDQVNIPLNPGASDVAALREKARGYGLVIVCTINANGYPEQAAVVNALLESGVRVVAVALRLPSDLEAYPAAPTYVCTYSLQPPSLEALAAALWGHIPFKGRLPVTVQSL